jgi:hypothetical protein
MMHPRTVALAFTLSLLALLGVACESSQPTERQLADQRLLEKRHARRTLRLERTAGAIERSEASRPERLGRTVSVLAPRLERDAKSVERDVETLGYYIQRDFDRWAERQPLYWDTAGRLLWGDPDSIPSTAIILFW